jgi:8-oxo-dGTP pyrophosphatase MutT (NUDIX family)
MKTVKHSIALVIPGASGRLLLVLRPADDDTLPGLWGLPAVTTQPGEGEDDAVRRAGAQKLGVEVVPGALIGEAESDTEAAAIRMRDREATIAAGIPKVPQRHPGTQYVDWRWGDPADLRPAARDGSLCCQILLRARELRW